VRGRKVRSESASNASRTPWTTADTRSGWRTTDDRRPQPPRMHDFIQRQHEADTPFFVWMNMTHMTSGTHTKPESRARSGSVGSRA